MLTMDWVAAGLFLGFYLSFGAFAVSMAIARGRQRTLLAKSQLRAVPSSPEKPQRRLLGPNDVLE
jgi:ABC-type spermidine/putrescine transport system permease subunit II